MLRPSSGESAATDRACSACDARAGRDGRRFEQIKVQTLILQAVDDPRAREGGGPIAKRIAGAAISLFMLVVYFHPLTIIGTGLGIAILVALR
jgi:hypothetical protein